MPNQPGFNGRRILIAIILAELLPVLLLILVVFGYSLIRQPDSPTPEEFAPQAGNWVGPIAGFVMTFLLGRWAALPMEKKILHGTAVGIGTACLDLGLGILMGALATIPVLLLISNGGRILAGFLGGLAQRK